MEGRGRGLRDRGGGEGEWWGKGVGWWGGGGGWMGGVGIGTWFLLFVFLFANQILPVIIL